MNRLFKFLILVLTFQLALGGSNFYKEEQKRKKIEEVKRKQQEASERALREVCSVRNNYEVPDCVSLRKKDAESAENRRLAAEQQASYKRYCEGNPYDFQCGDNFGFPNTPLGWVFFVISWIIKIISAYIVFLPFAFVAYLFSL